MRPRLVLIAVCSVALGASALSVAGPGVQAGPAPAPACDPLTTPTYARDVPSPRQVLGDDFGTEQVSVADSDRYLLTVARRSDRVEAGVLARSQLGRPLRYAVVGQPRRVDAAQEAAALLRDPATSAAEAAEIAAEAPAILWVAGNVHGNEPSGTDASLRALRDVTDRTDCAGRAVRRGAVVVVLPTQNPDGRVAETRRNAYGFDLNRDWFARTQPETDGKLEALRAYPPSLFLDVHEMGGTSYFMPPNADPIHHEITDRNIAQINDVFGGAMADSFDTRGIDYFNEDVYDLLYMGYGDSVPTTGFLGAGMTLEKGSESPYSDRVSEQYLAIWSSLVAGGQQHERLLSDLGADTRQAYRQGLAGRLEPNKVYNPGNEVESEVPDITVRHWFLRADQPGHAEEVARIVRRLQRMDVAVYQLTAPLRVRDFTPYGRDARRTTLPTGTYWVPMAQGQKHWVEAMLGEDSYVPFPYFYDVTAWSLPLLADVSGGRSGARLDPQAVPAAPQPEPDTPEPPVDAPEIGMWQMSADYTESPGWLRWLLTEHWGVPYRSLDSTDIRGGGLAAVDVLLVPDGDAAEAEEALGTAGGRALRSWLADGGRLVAWSGGTEMAARMALTSARLTDPTSDVPGSLLRVRVDRGSPLSAGLGSDAWMFYEYDSVMRVADTALAPVAYPASRSPAWFVSGFSRGARELGRTAAVVDEPYADGRVVLFAGEPNFRGFTEGTQTMVWNAVFGADAPAARAPASTRGQRVHAAELARDLTELAGRIVVTVRSGAAAEAADAVAAAGFDRAAVHRERAAGQTRFVLRPRDGQPRAVSRLVAALAPLGDDVLAVYAPR